MTKYIIKKGEKYWPSPEMKKIALAKASVYKEGLKDPIKFWATRAMDGLNWDKKWDKTYVEKLPYFEWFKGGKLNFCYNCVDRWLEKRGNETALIWVPEPVNEKPVKLTYQELYYQVCKF